MFAASDLNGKFIYKMLTLELITFLSGQFETLVPRWLCCQWKSLSGGGCGVERRLEVGE